MSDTPCHQLRHVAAGHVFLQHVTRVCATRTRACASLQRVQARAGLGRSDPHAVAGGHVPAAAVHRRRHLLTSTCQ